MGQKNGKAVFNEEAAPFTNLSENALERLWEAFNDVADGFGVSQYEIEEICAELLDELKVNRTKMNEKTSALFAMLDSGEDRSADEWVQRQKTGAKEMGPPPRRGRYGGGGVH